MKKTKKIVPQGYDPDYFRVDKKTMYKVGQQTTLEEVLLKNRPKSNTKAA